MKFKQFFLATTLSIAGISSAYAGSTEVLGSGLLDWGANLTKSGITGAIDNTFTFQSASASPASFDFQVYSYSNITGLTATLTNLATHTAVSVPFVSGGALQWDMENLDGVFTLAPATNYSLQVTGTFVPWASAASGAYNVAVTVAAVPEPETFAMLLAGLGLVGFIGRRRSRMQMA